MNASAIEYIRRITTDPYPDSSLDYRVCRAADDITRYLQGGYPVLSCDTESYPNGSPYCLTFSHTPGTGRLIYVRDRDLIEEFTGAHTCYGLAQENEYTHLLFHNYLHDINVFDELGIPVGQFTDTMVRAYNLCLGGGGDDDGEGRAGRGSLGLKSLAFRFLNMRMTSFKDTVFPHSIPHLLRYLEEAKGYFSYEPRSVKRCQCGCLQPRHLIKGARGLHHGSCVDCPCPKYRAQKHAHMTEEEERLNRLYRKVSGLADDINTGKCERDQDEEDDIVNPWKRVDGWHEYDWEYLRKGPGVWPVPSIEHVPEPELLRYAVRDADATLRLYHFFKDYRPWVFF